MNLKTIESYFDRLWPICRSISGNGLRESFEILKEIIPFNLHEVPSGQNVLDWQIPKEWNIYGAYIEDEAGNKVVDYEENNLHVLNYSIPVNEIISGEELKKYLYYKEDLPNAIPYVTSYYKERWGFCLSYNQYTKINFSQNFRVFVDSKLEKGSLTYGDIKIKGRSKKEVLFSSYLCHPSMANNELSGPLTIAFLYDELSKRKDLKYSYRFVVAPETIGSIAYLHDNGEELINNVIAGYVLTCCGDSASLAMKESRRGDSIAEWVTQTILKKIDPNLRVDEFDVDGSDERQFCSPGFNLPVVSLFRSKYSEYKEYHTSLDDKKFFNFNSIAENVELILKMIDLYEGMHVYERVDPFGEPQLGKRGLYEDLATKSSHSEALKMRMRILNYCDGLNSLEQFSIKYEYDLNLVLEEVKVLEEKRLIRRL